MADLNKTVAIVFDATDLTSDKLAKIQTGLQGLVKDTDATGDSAKKAGDNITRMGADGESSVFSLTNAMRALAASFVVREFLDANIEAEKLDRTFTVLTGSSEAASAALEYIRGVADRLGVDANDLADAFGKFSAATAGSSIEGEKARLIFEGFSGAMATLGASTVDISGAMVQLSQGVSKGKFELEDLKSIAERVPGFFNLMAEAVGVTTEELFKMVSQGQVTGDTMVQVAELLKDKYGDVAYVDTFSAAWERMKNALAEFATESGKAGTMDKLKDSINLAALALDFFAEKLKSVKAEDAGTLGVDESAILQMSGPAGGIASLIDKLILIGGAYLKIRSSAEDAGGAMERFLLSIDSADAAGLEQIRIALEQMYREGNLGAEEYNILQDAILSKAQGVWPGVAQEIEKSTLSTKELEAASKQVDTALKALGLDPKQIYEPAEEAAAKIQAAIADLVNNPTTKPEEMFSGLITAIDQLARDQLPALKAAAEGALSEGKLDAEQYAAVMDAIEQKAVGNWPAAFQKTADAVKKTADDTKKAEEAAQKYQLELEKMASNERIKLIESTVTLNVAGIERDAKIAEALLNGLAATYGNNLELIGTLAGELSESLNTRKDYYIRNLMDEARNRANELHDAQMDMIGAQVDYLRARAAKASRGDALITVQAAGLEPQLEAFMWQIFRNIQLRASQEGADFLLGGCSI